MMQLTPHFQLSEFERSKTASQLHIDNRIPARLIPSVKALCEHVLEPVRNHFGVPIHISSGYRCTALNKAVGGAPKSQHMKGQAADIYINAPPLTLRDIYLWMVDNLSFDQLIWEVRGGGRSKWIHVSYKNEKANRQQVFTCKR